MKIINLIRYILSKNYRNQINREKTFIKIQLKEMPAAKVQKISDKEFILLDNYSVIQIENSNSFNSLPINSYAMARWFKGYNEDLSDAFFFYFSPISE